MKNYWTKRTFKLCDRIIVRSPNTFVWPMIFDQQNLYGYVYAFTVGGAIEVELDDGRHVFIFDLQDLEHDLRPPI